MSKTPETVLKDEVVAFLNKSGLFYRRMHSGGTRVKRGFLYLGPEGTADFLVFRGGFPQNRNMADDSRDLVQDTTHESEQVMAIDEAQSETVRGGWGGRRTRRRADPSRPLSILHAEIDAVNKENLRRIARARSVCDGELLDEILARYAKRLIAKGAVGLITPEEHV